MLQLVGLLAVGCTSVDADADACVTLHLPDQHNACDAGLTVTTPPGATFTVVLEASTSDGRSQGAATIDHSGASQSGVAQYQWSSPQLPIPGAVTVQITIARVPGPGPFQVPSVVKLHGSVEDSIPLVLNVVSNPD